jgi:hypothetical protein
VRVMPIMAVILAALVFCVPSVSLAGQQLAQVIWEYDEAFPQVPERGEEAAPLKTTIRPSITIGEGYNDNIYLTTSDKESDFITRVSPELEIYHATRSMSLMLNYTFSYEYYARHSEESEALHKAEVDYSLSALKDIFHLRVYDKYGRRTIDRRGAVALDNTLVNLTDSNQFYVSPSIEYPLSRTFFVVLEYSYENLWYEAEDANNTQNHRMGGGLRKSFSPGTTASVFYFYTMRRPDITGDENRQEVTFRLDSKLTPRLSLSGEVGHVFFDYEDREDAESTVWNVQAEYLLSKLFSVGAGYSLSVNESIDAGTSEKREVSGSLIYKGKVQAEATVFRYTDDFSTLDREDRATGGAVRMFVPLLPSLSGFLEGWYTYFEFLPGDDRENRYNARLGLDYTLRITTLSFSYTYNQNDSNVSGRDFKNNVVWIMAKFSV